jgi:sulfatase maturation enzyme AslB (radical SAM superfamily)
MIKYDIEVDWNINDYCNFDCKYCFDQSDKKKKNAGYNDIQKIVDGFRHSGLTWLIHMSGGEPQFFPGFIQLCEMLTEKHFVSMNTNLSHKNIFTFAEKIPPEKVGFIHCSLHIQERERLNLVQDYIDKYNMLKKNGFYVFASYVMYPQLIKRFEKDYENFKKEGIILMPKIYRGNYHTLKIGDYRIFGKLNKLFYKDYPSDYSHRQKSIILKYIEKSQHDMKLKDLETPNIGEARAKDLTYDVLFINGLLSFKGKLCLAGKNFVKMTSHGDVYRCQDENLFLGNLFSGNLELFDKAALCAANICSCPYHGIRYVMESENREARN